MDSFFQRMRSGRAARVLLGAGLSLALAGCGHRSVPEAHLCLDILKRRSPAAQVVEIAAEPDLRRAAIEYRVKGAPATSRLACEFQETETGGLRVRSVAVDGQPLLEAELAVIDADLLFDDMRRGGAERGLHR